MASGRVQLDRVNALQANITAGEVAIGHIAGRANIDGAAFAMRISEVKDTVKLSSSGGQTWIGHASADLDHSSRSKLTPRSPGASGSRSSGTCGHVPRSASERSFDQLTPARLRSLPGRLGEPCVAEAVPRGLLDPGHVRVGTIR